jgi:hypothetical protein
MNDLDGRWPRRYTPAERRRQGGQWIVREADTTADLRRIVGFLTDEPVPPVLGDRETRGGRSGAQLARIRSTSLLDYAVPMSAHNHLTGTVSDDPLAHLPVGTSISIEPVVVGGSDAATVPDGVVNWDFFQGALLAVGVRLPESPSVVVNGTAVVIAPGLAVTATHVLSEALPHLPSGGAEVLCIGVRSEHLDLWRVRKVSYTDTDDVAYLSLQLASPWVKGWSFTSLRVTTRCPRRGEKLTIFGFRLDDVQTDSQDFSAAGNLYAAAGTVTGVYHPRHFLPSLPFPTIDIACGSLGAMSGGAVLDHDGLLVGMISRGWTTDDMEGPTYAAWIVGALNRKLEIPWPPSVYGDEIHILDIPEQLLHMTGRDAIVVVDENMYDYRVWFE